MANTAEPRRRFAPVPIETTFEQYRKTGPAAELTPSPSPRSESPPTPPPREKRKFAPQLVESSVRRSRRIGDDGPATRHTDRTDITPYTNHIYAPRTKRRHGRSNTREQAMALTRRESCDDEIAGDLFDLVAKDAQRKLQEAALSAFPNSNIRIGGAEHFYVREGSDDDNTPARGRAATRGTGRVRLSRRNSSTEDISWAFKEMQEHAAMMESRQERISTPDLDRMSIDGPPSDAMGLTRAQRQSLSGSPLWTASRPSSSGSRGAIGEHHMPFVRPESPLPTIGESTMPYLPPASPPIRPIGETLMPYIPSAPAGKAADMAYAPPSKIPAESGFASSRPSPSPFTGFRNDRDMSLERLRNLHRLRTNASPPMLGSDLTFRMCPSPAQTKLEPDHLWDLQTGTTTDEPNRDATGERGLWRGYCYTTDKSEKLALAERPAMISTPYPLTTPGDPFARAFSMSPTTVPIFEEPAPAAKPSLHPLSNLHVSASAPVEAEHLTHHHHHEPKGLHMLQGLDERLRQEQAAADLEDKIVEEFDDTFVTQVYNYLSLGYPATARIYDEELSKISRINLDDLEQDDDAVMDSFCGEGATKPLGAPNGKKANGTGYIMLDSGRSNGVDGLGENERTPRWRALKEYIYEWARQHPDLNAISPLAWGMQERRGSWGL